MQHRSKLLRIFILAVLSLILVLAGCSEDNGTGTDDTSSSSSSASRTEGIFFEIDGTSYSLGKGMIGTFNWTNADSSFPDADIDYDGTPTFSYTTNMGGGLLAFCSFNEVPFTFVTNDASPEDDFVMFVIAASNQGAVSNGDTITNEVMVAPYVSDYTNLMQDYEIIDKKTCFTADATAAGDYYEGTFHIVFSNESTSESDLVIVTNGSFYLQRMQDKALFFEM